MWVFERPRTMSKSSIPAKRDVAAVHADHGGIDGLLTPKRRRHDTYSAVPSMSISRPSSRASSYGSAGPSWLSPATQGASPMRRGEEEERSSHVPGNPELLSLGSSQRLPALLGQNGVVYGGSGGPPGRSAAVSRRFRNLLWNGVCEGSRDVLVLAGSWTRQV